jgi:maleylpyruvate isomerase
MKLYGYFRSSASYRIRIILNCKGLAYEYVPVMLNRGEHHDAAFRAISPLGFVPVLHTGDTVLSQSPAIAEFLEETHPSPPLLPGDPTARARVREMLNIVGCDIHPIQNLRILNYLRSEYGQDDQGVLRWCQRWIGDGFAAFEKLATARSSGGRYAVGDELTLADVWLIPQVSNARRFELDLAPYPAILAIDQHCRSLPAFQAADPARQPDAAMV